MRPGGIPVQVEASWQSEAKRLHFVNDTEILEVNAITRVGDSIFFALPVFETAFRLRQTAPDTLKGILTKGIANGIQEWQVVAHPAAGRVPQANQPALVNLSGRWAVEFQRADGSWRPAVAEWQQQGNRLTGTIVNPSGDYRYLEGAVWGRQFYLSAFDGAHIYAFTGHVPTDSTIANGIFFSGRAPGDAWRAVKNAHATLPDAGPVTGVVPGRQQLSFAFPDLDSNLVSLSDERFKGKVVVVQLMGSWCPNCMDETRFLNEFYLGQAKREVEVVALAYELSTNFGRSAAALRKLQARFGVAYPMLITGARSADADKAAKTLPQLTDIKYFPTTLFVDKTGRIRQVHSGFFGPGAPAYFQAYKQQFFETINRLLRE
jgi:thiol-disulfide isomerase/thioredoxin